jgi:N6-adenosine-specific RNA methylase IME4
MAATEVTMDEKTLYRCILMDPPWLERGGGQIRRGADRHYPLMKTPDILRTVLQSGAFNPDPEGCALFMWVTNSFLKDGLWLMEALDFRYVTNLCWLKRGNPGLGQWFRSRHELLLFGVRGRAVVRTVRTDNRKIPGGMYLDRPGRHSRKPEEFYRIIEARTVGPRLEMFARNTREGWFSWGNEVPVEDQRKPE